MYVTISSDGSALRREPGGLGFESPVELFFFFFSKKKREISTKKLKTFFRGLEKNM